MKIRIILLCAFSSIYFSVFSFTNIVAGPMVGHTTPTSTVVWYGHRGKQAEARLISEEQIIKPTHYETFSNGRILIKKAYFENLTPNTNYQISFFNESRELETLRDFFVKTSDTIEYSDISFIMGSCALTFPFPFEIGFPGTHRRIFKAMSDENADFMVWLGDWVYYLGKHRKSFDGMFNRSLFQRSYFMGLRKFFSEQPSYAIWDDHEYGPNNGDGSWIKKQQAKMVFDQFWCNPEDTTKKGEGIYYNLKHKDLDFFMLDNRYNRVLNDSIQEMFGKEQMQWLISGLKKSTASFKFITAGGQMIKQSRMSTECFPYYKKEFNDLMQAIRENKIEGVVFLSGDIHSSELLKTEIKGIYPLYEYTSSPLTSMLSKKSYIPQELVNGTLVDEKHNYGKLKITGEKGNRKLTMSCNDRKGRTLWEYVITQKELSF